MTKRRDQQPPVHPLRFPAKVVNELNARNIPRTIRPESGVFLPDQESETTEESKPETPRELRPQDESGDASAGESARPQRVETRAATP